MYQKIEEARNRGLFQKDLKAKTGITNPNVIRSIIDKLVRRRLIKDFTTVHTGKKKMYILADLEPSADLTGGNWYANGELDMALVEACKHTATRFLMEKRREKEGATIKEVRSRTCSYACMSMLLFLPSCGALYARICFISCTQTGLRPICGNSIIFEIEITWCFHALRALALHASE